MRYENILPAIFLDRPNRFIAHVDIGGHIETVHVKNTGRCKELLIPGTEVYLTAPNSPHRKTNYIRRFEFINNPDNDENDKWRVAFAFHDLMNPDHPAFPDRIALAQKKTANLIDGANRYAFSAMVKCCDQEEKTVRALFRALFAEDGGDLSVRQRRIQTFMDDSNALIARLVLDNAMFMNDQRSVMAYLFFNDPNHHYLYKATEAQNFASCIEYYDDWGPGTDFHLDVYHRMCDSLVEEIRKSPELLKTHASRYIGRDGATVEGMHSDDNYHLLAFDIIYGAPENRYNFYEGIPFSSIAAQERKLHQERTEEAQLRAEHLSVAQKDADLLIAAEAYFHSAITVGMKVMHKRNGLGEIIAIDHQDGDESLMTIQFYQSDKVAKFQLMSAFAGGFLTAEIPDMAEHLLQFRDVILRGKRIRDGLTRAQKEYEAYKEYLE